MITNTETKFLSLIFKNEIDNPKHYIIELLTNVDTFNHKIPANMFNNYKEFIDSYHLFGTVTLNF